jgi:hypothetical protein
MYNKHELWMPSTWQDTVLRAMMITNFKLEISELFFPEFTNVYEMEYSILKEMISSKEYPEDAFYIVHIIEEYENWLKSSYDISSLIDGVKQ